MMVERRPAVSVVIPSYQRRLGLMRLLESLDGAIGPEDDVEVVVVLDGSTDGSRDALRDANLELDLRWRWQANAGRSAARNAGLAMARGEICWFLDDDMTVDRTAFETHVAFHDLADEPAVLLGPQWEPAADDPIAHSLSHRIARLADTGTVDDPQDFWTGSVSIPRETLLDLGGFSEEFVGWGAEDIELAFRLKKNGIPIRFDPDAGGVHWRERSPQSVIREARELGRNLVRLYDAHPEATAHIYRASSLVVDLHDRNIRSPFVYGGLAGVASIALRSARIGASRIGNRVRLTGVSASLLAGVLEAGGSERVQRRVLVRERIFMRRTSGEHSRELPTPDAGTVDARRIEYESTGMLRRCLPLAEPDAVEAVAEDAPWFARSVAELRRHGEHRVPYRFTPNIEALACDPRLTSVVEEILGDDRWVAWGANVQTGTPNAAHEWHVDIESIHWPSITVMVGIAGCRDDNATRYIPGSHNLAVGPRDSGDPCDDELVLATAEMLDPRCRSAAHFEGFGDGTFAVFDARGWHCGDTAAAAGRVVLFLHYQRADDLRIPYMRDFTRGTWSDTAAPFMVNPVLGDDYEHRVHPPPVPPRRVRKVLRR